jgi:hypothetical protein
VAFVQSLSAILSEGLSQGALPNNVARRPLPCSPLNSSVSAYVVDVKSRLTPAGYSASRLMLLLNCCVRLTFPMPLTASAGIKYFTSSNNTSLRSMHLISNATDSLPCCLSRSSKLNQPKASNRETLWVPCYFLIDWWVPFSNIDNRNEGLKPKLLSYRSLYFGVIRPLQDKKVRKRDNAQAV